MIACWQIPDCGGFGICFLGIEELNPDLERLKICHTGELAFFEDLHYLLYTFFH